MAQLVHQPQPTYKDNHFDFIEHTWHHTVNQQPTYIIEAIMAKGKSRRTNNIEITMTKDQVVEDIKVAFDKNNRNWNFGRICIIIIVTSVVGFVASGVIGSLKWIIEYSLDII